MLQTAQPTRDGAVTAVCQTAVQIVFTPPDPRNGDPITVFLGKPVIRTRTHGWLAMLLITTGDAGTNPGLTWKYYNLYIRVRDEIMVISACSL